MVKTRISWREKLETQNQEAQIHKVLIPRHLDVEGIIQSIPKGKLVTDRQIGERLTRDYHVDITCAKVTGISIWIIANAAEEDLSQGRKQITLYWRVLRKDGSLNEKFPGGVETQAARLREEGYTIEGGKGRKLRVRDFERALVGL
jgi:alkylated DNA nucleotide flippase Atl1